MARRSLVGLVVALALVCSACAVDATVTVEVREDGSGVVRVDVTADAEAVQAAEAGGVGLEERVRLTDLPDAGWTVEPWVRDPDGSASLTLRKPFTSVDQVAGILGELNGDAGPLREASFTRSRSLLATEFRADALVDLGALGTGILADPELVASLQAQGLDVAGVDQLLLTQLQDALRVRLVVELPGGKRTVVEPEPGQAATLEASSSVADTTRIGLLVAALVLVATAVAVALWPRRRGRRRPRGAATASALEGPQRRPPVSWEEATRARTPPTTPAPPPRRRR